MDFFRITVLCKIRYKSRTPLIVNGICLPPRRENSIRLFWIFSQTELQERFTSAFLSSFLTFKEQQTRMNFSRSLRTFDANFPSKIHDEFPRKDTDPCFVQMWRSILKTSRRKTCSSVFVRQSNCFVFSMTLERYIFSVALKIRF